MGLSARESPHPTSRDGQDDGSGHKVQAQLGEVRWKGSLLGDGERKGLPWSIPFPAQRSSSSGQSLEGSPKGRGGPAGEWGPPPPSPAPGPRPSTPALARSYVTSWLKLAKGSWLSAASPARLARFMVGAARGPCRGSRGWGGSG